jgi:hypothetical protein
MAREKEKNPREGFTVGCIVKHKDGREGKLYAFENYELACIDVGKKSYPIWRLEDCEPVVIKDDLQVEEAKWYTGLLHCFREY